MLFKPLFQRAVLVQLSAFSTRRFTAAAMATPQSFALDRSIFNEELYAKMRTFWFDGLSDQEGSPPFSLMQKWFAVGKSDAEKTAFDGECRANFISALESIGPEHLTLPPFKGYESEIADAGTIAAPFVAEVRNAQKVDPNKARDTLLSLVLLLDQMPRNIYRDQEGLNLVYKFYDRLAFCLIRSTLSTSPEIVAHESGKSNPMRDPWIWMPMLHSEDGPSHLLARKKMEQNRAEAVEAGDENALQYTDQALKSYDQHYEPIEKFGRYPHRNECLGRKNTEEEEKYMETAETFGVKQNKKPAGKDEL